MNCKSIFMLLLLLLITTSLSSDKIVRREPTPGSNAMTVKVEQDGDRSEEDGDAADEGSGPIDAEGLELYPVDNSEYEKNS